jgi:hypothetical protein
MRSRCMSLLPQTTLQSDSEQLKMAHLHYCIIIKNANLVLFYNYLYGYMAKPKNCIKPLLSNFSS